MKGDGTGKMGEVEVWNYLEEMTIGGEFGDRSCIPVAYLYVSTCYSEVLNKGRAGYLDIF
jgi:hypothetical protein